MKKIFFAVLLFVSLIVSGYPSGTEIINNSGYSGDNFISLEDPVEVWREYVLNGDQWYLIIYYDDGSIGIWPVAKPPED